jgi:hypothetical protein
MSNASANVDRDQPSRQSFEARAPSSIGELPPNCVVGPLSQALVWWNKALKPRGARPISNTIDAPALLLLLTKTLLRAQHLQQQPVSGKCLYTIG